MLFCVVLPHPHAVHHSLGASRQSAWQAQRASCAQVHACAINLFAYISKSVYAHVCIVGINIPSVILSALIRTMCLRKSAHVCIKCVFSESTPSCPSGAAMLSRSASSLNSSNKPVVCCFVHTYVHSYVHIGTQMCSHTCLTQTFTHILIELLSFFQEKEAEKWPKNLFTLSFGATAPQPAGSVKNKTEGVRG